MSNKLYGKKLASSCYYLIGNPDICQLQISRSIANHNLSCAKSLAQNWHLSSTTYKLMLSKGDIKSVQGDTGHATADMVTRVYAHVLDENRKENAKVFEQEFYSVSDLKNAKPTENINSEADVKALLEQLERSPELIAVMKNLISNVTATVEV